MTNPMFPEPMPPIGDPEKPPKPPVPKEVNIAFVVWVVSTALSTVLQIIGTDAVVEQYMRQNANAAETLSASTLKTTFIVATVVVGLVMLLFAWKMRAGKKWARAVLAILAILGLMYLAITAGFADAISIVSVLITAVGLVYMFVPASNAYFNEVTGRRR